MNNVVAIIGRPNVGKSTLFNRIARERISIVEDSPGVTRDRIYSYANWLTKKFILIDTGGITFKNTSFQEEIKLQADIAIAEADIIFFVVSYKDGITDEDNAIAKLLYKSKKRVILVINKYDRKELNNDIYDFMSLGFGEPFPISASHGIGLGDLLDETISLFSDKNTKEVPDEISFCIIGKPNVGKSSLVNSILNENRVIVSDKAGTTTDSVHSFFQYNKRKYRVIDTAGIRQKGRINEKIEKYSWIRSIKSVDLSDIVLLILDSSKDITDLDTNIGGIAKQADKPVIIVLNKNDLLKNKSEDYKKIEEEVKNKFKYLKSSFIVFVSATNKDKINKLLDTITRVYDASNKHIKTSLLNEVLVKAQLLNPPPNFNGGRLKIFYSSQPSVRPITFILFVNNKKYVHFSYERFIENQIRDNFDFNGVNIKLIFRTKK